MLFQVGCHKINICFSADLAVEAKNLLGDRQKSMHAPEMALGKVDRDSLVEEIEALEVEMTPQRFVNRISRSI